MQFSSLLATENLGLQVSEALRAMPFASGMSYAGGLKLRPRSDDRVLPICYGSCTLKSKIQTTLVETKAIVRLELNSSLHLKKLEVFDPQNGIVLTTRSF